MAKIDFIPMTIRNLKPSSQSVEYFEKGRNHGEGAFGLRISTKNKRTWFIMYKADAGKVKRFSLGTYPKTSLKDARKLAGDTMARVHNGNDPMQEKQTKRAARTVIDLWAFYQKKLALESDKKAPSTVSEEQRRWNTFICPTIGHMKVEDITPMIITALLDPVAEKAPVSANRLHTLLKIMFKVALGQHWITVHPMQWLDRPGGSEPPRKRVLSDDEIKKLWSCLDQVQPTPRDLLKLGLLTAQRSGEILNMRWENIDFEKARSYNPLIEKLVYIQDGNLVADLTREPQNALLKINEFYNSFKNLPKITNGESKPISQTTAWLQSPKRKLVRGCSFAPGEDTISHGDGEDWFNSFYMPNGPNLSILRESMFSSNIWSA